MIERKDLLDPVGRGLKTSPLTALLGPRQCGKTTLAKSLLRIHQGSYFDLEAPADFARLDQPQQALQDLRGLVVIDEIQRKPELFPLLRTLADRRPLRARFLLLGSASPWLSRRTSETLAGRVRLVEMGGFNAIEIGPGNHRRLWLRGGFPRSFLAQTDKESFLWRADFISTFLERDIPQMDIRAPAVTLRRFWTMTAHYHGQTWNSSEIGASMGFSHNTARSRLDALTGAFVLRQLPPYFVNLGKRLVKAPKVYVRDSGLLHALLGIRTRAELESNPKLGASWEGFALEQTLSWTGDRNAFFWATHAGAELDLLIERGGRRWGFEYKYADAPVLTRSMSAALRDLELEKIWVVYPGAHSYSLNARIEAIPLSALRALPARLREA